MIRLKNIHPLSEFQRNAKSYVSRLKKTGEPAVLTVNGEAELVVLSADAFQKLVEEFETVRTLNALHRGMLDSQQGKGIPAEEAFATLERKFRARRRRKAS